MTYARDERRQRRAEKEIMESVVLTDYILFFGLNQDDIRNYNSKAVRAALDWKKEKETKNV